MMLKCEVIGRVTQAGRPVVSEGALALDVESRPTVAGPAVMPLGWDSG